MSAYYNEHDPFAAAWLRELIADGLIADGKVDERDIQTLDPDDLRGFTQCHFFAGIGGWSLALRLAGWPDDRPVWTGSCPCQPFSAAVAQAGGTDPRHLWPTWYHLIRECRPPVVFGEQVESAVAHGWLDLVSDDLEREGYAVGAVGLPACSVGAPHIRQRLWFVAESGGVRTGRDAGAALSAKAGGESSRGADGQRCGDTSELVGSTSLVAHTQRANHRCQTEAPDHERSPSAIGSTDQHGGCRGAFGLLADAQRGATERRRHDVGSLVNSNGGGCRQDDGQRPECDPTNGGGKTDRRGGGSNLNPWADLLWLPCRDGKARPTQPGLFPLAHGISNRVGILRGAGNAIVAPLAAEFVKAYSEGVTTWISY